MRSNNITVLVIGIVTLTLGFAAITSSYNIVGLAHAAKPQFCYHRAGDMTHEPTHCSSTHKECDDRRTNDPASDGRCVPVKTS